ncbi:MAG TPA: PAS domain S-box protein [Kofleriaceae bacterium]
MLIAAFLRDHRDQILADWNLGATDLAAAAGRGGPALARIMPRLIDDFARIIGGERGLVEPIAGDCAAELLECAAPVSVLVRELSLLRRCVLRSWRERNPSGLRAEAERVSAEIDAVVERTIDHYLDLRTNLLDAFERIAVSAVSAADLDGLLRELLAIFARLVPSLDALAIYLRQSDRLELCASRGPVPRPAGELATSLEPGLTGPSRCRVPLLDGTEIIGVAEAQATTRGEVSVLEQRLFGMVARHAATAIAHRRRRAEASKRAAELDTFIEAIPSPVFLGTADRLSNANRAGLDLLGLTSRTELGRLGAAELGSRIQLRDPVTGVPVPHGDSAFGRALGGEHVSIDCHAKGTRAAEQHLYRCIAGPVIVDGKLDGAVLVMSDITDIRRAEDQFRAMFERVPMAIAQSDPMTGRVIRANARLCELTGYSMEETIGRSFTDWTHPDDRAASLEQYARMIRGEVAIMTAEKRYIRKDGSIAWVRVTASLLPSPGEPPRVLATIEDITARRNAELEREELVARDRAAAERLRILAGVTRALSEARLDLERLLDVIADELTKQIADGCVVHLASEDGRMFQSAACRHVDPAAQTLLRKATSRPVPFGEGLSGRTAAAGKTLAFDQITTEELRTFIAPRFHKLGEHVQTWALLCAPLKVAGRVLGVITVARGKATLGGTLAFSAEDRLLVEEIADRAALAIDSARLLVREHQARKDAERAQAELGHAAEFRERFLGIVSHDLRNPLGAISLAAQSLACAPGMPDGSAKALARIRSSAERMGQMIGELLDLTRGRLGGGIPVEPKRTELGSIVQGAIDELELAHPSRRIAFAAGGIFEGDYDEARLAQVASNLIGNALQHSPPDTEVTVSLVDRGGAGVALEVRNGGAPIPTELLPHLFDPFRRGNRSSSGLGLGLFIVAEVVRAHGGTIRVASTATDGTTFTVELPRRLAHA